jgi:hypothetical protein
MLSASDPGLLDAAHDAVVDGRDDPHHGRTLRLTEPGKQFLTHQAPPLQVSGQP